MVDATRDHHALLFAFLRNAGGTAVVGLRDHPLRRRAGHSRARSSGQPRDDAARRAYRKPHPDGDRSRAGDGGAGCGGGLRGASDGADVPHHRHGSGGGRRGRLRFRGQHHDLRGEPSVEQQPAARAARRARPGSRGRDRRPTDLDLLPYVEEGAVITSSASGSPPPDDVTFDGHYVVEVEAL